MASQTIKNIVLINEYEHELRRFNLTARRFEFRFLDYNGQGTPIDWLRRGLNALINNGMRGFENNDRVGITFFNADFPDRPLPMSFRRRDQISTDAILDTLGKVLQSNANFFTNNLLTMTIDRFQLPNGNGAGLALKGSTYEDFCAKKRGIRYFGLVIGTSNAEAIYVHNSRKICITANYNVISRSENKIYRTCYTKRQRVENSYDTVPYGYNDPLINQNVLVYHQEPPQTAETSQPEEEASPSCEPPLLEEDILLN
ncbi:unnamed protein product [Brassicogethes aeneus]|uniref:Uncharacterized protein n=1 Tax=Brassicogethes aeneus TaxID=1431903 RepID=A0A9P0ARX1_BRAAE|nr:unnamed protein product [Brassicogethes aeneus]